MPNNRWISIASSADGSKLVAVAGGKSPSPVYFSTNSGVSWTTNEAPNQVWATVASSANGNILIASTASYLASNLVFISTNAGATWTPNTSVPSPRRLAGSADGQKWIGSVGNGGIYTSEDFGATWISNNVPNGYWSAVASSADGSKLAAAMTVDPASYRYQIYVSVDSGTTWDVTSATNLTWTSIAFSADGTKLAAVAVKSAYTQSAICNSTDSGTNWTLMHAPDNRWYSIASSADGNTLIAAAPYDHTAQIAVPIYISTNGGNTWNMTSPQSEIWQSVACSADGNKLVAIAAGGSIWTYQSIPAPSIHFMPTNGSLQLSWVIPSANFVLQQNPDLTTTNWMDMTNPPVLNLINMQNQVVVPLTDSNGFYRLVSP